MGNVALLKPKDAAATKEFARQVRARLQTHVLDLKLFGSKTMGRDVEESDIDVLVVVDQNTPELEDQVLEIAFDVNVAHDVYISPRAIGKAVLDDPVWKITPFLRHIATEGVPL
ncbi:MAG TPA: nucleotidyltransferase domain-containing protein [Nitrospiraceae bacterium]|nr:nucleotidyltransferase domain-containing protein [Nitrospiraceae bacterium]